MAVLTRGNRREIRGLGSQIGSDWTIAVGFFAMAAGAVLVKQFGSWLRLLGASVDERSELETYGEKDKPTICFPHESPHVPFPRLAKLPCSAIATEEKTVNPASREVSFAFRKWLRTPLGVETHLQSVSTVSNYLA